MQLLLSLAQEPQESSNPSPSRPEVWLTLRREQRNELLELLARLLAKTAAASAASSSTAPRKELPDE